MSTEARTNADARGEALRTFEEACNVMAIVFADQVPVHGERGVREIVITARGDVREALGEGRT